MMKILFLSNSLGGLRCFRYELIQFLLNRGDEIYIGANCEESPSFFQQIGCHVIPTPMNLRGTNFFADLKLCFTYAWLLFKLKPDVVLTYTIKPNVYGGMLCRLLKKKQIASVTGLGSAFENSGYIYKIAIALYRCGLAKCDTILFQNQESLSVFEHLNIGVNSKKVVVAGSGVNLGKFMFYDYPLEDGNLNFLFVGKTRKEKGIDHYLEAAVKLKQRYPQCKFHIVGACEENYGAKLLALQQAKIVEYHGLQYDVRPFFKMSHCCILPSYHEGMSNCLQESSACGRPVITTNISGCREIVDINKSGYVIPPKDTEALINAIEKFIALPYVKKAQMGIAARSWVERYFDRNKVIKTYVDLL
jgi:glycosyltransferase involved in cell wall biosynthesis